MRLRSSVQCATVAVNSKHAQKGCGLSFRYKNSGDDSRSDVHEFGEAERGRSVAEGSEREEAELPAERCEAEAKAKNMEEEISRLHKSLEERNGQVQASASTAEKGLFAFVDLVELCVYSDFPF
ncbi:hypothetical protein C3L33_22078, partial [Rhododendron williamsianum]